MSNGGPEIAPPGSIFVRGHTLPLSDVTSNVAAHRAVTRTGDAIDHRQVHAVHRAVFELTAQMRLRKESLLGSRAIASQNTDSETLFSPPGELHVRHCRIPDSMLPRKRSQVIAKHHA